MRLSKSWTRLTYERSYRYMRRGYSFAYLYKLGDGWQDITQAADYSYQAKGYDVHGWLSDARRKRFHAIKYRSFSFAEDIPF